MLDYYDYTEDETFLTGELLPMARDVLAGSMPVPSR